MESKGRSQSWPRRSVTGSPDSPVHPSGLDRAEHCTWIGLEELETLPALQSVALIDIEKCFRS